MRRLLIERKLAQWSPLDDDAVQLRYQRNPLEHIERLVLEPRVSVVLQVDDRPMWLADIADRISSPLAPLARRGRSTSSTTA